MHLIIDGYNLLHSGRSQISLSPMELQWQRDRLIDQLSTYGRMRRLEVIVIFDGWQGGWTTEKKERRKGIELIFSKLGEKADDVIKRLVREKGSGAMVVTSDRDVSRFVERMAVPVIPSDQFQKKMEGVTHTMAKGYEEDDEGGKREKGKGPSRRLSKKARRAKAALKKL